MIGSCIVYGQFIPDSVLAFAHEKVEAFAQDYPGLSISISLDGNIAWTKNVGYKDLESQEPVTDDTQFNIYSTSKMITGLAYLHLVYKDEIENINQKIREIDPDLPSSYDDITINHLLQHTSGIRHYKGKKDWISFADLRCSSPREAMTYFINEPLKSTPGQKKTYTTFGIVVASHLLEKITGLSYIDAINDLVPLSTPLLLDSETADKATPYVRSKKSYEVYPNLSAECKYGGGGLLASSQQLAEACQLLYDGSIVPLEDIKKLMMQEWESGEKSGMSYAMGCGVAESSLGDQPVLFLAMGGASPGGRSYILVLTDLKIAIALTTNCEGDGDKAYTLAITLAKKIVGLE